jgi:hypothetical protein
VRTRPLEPEPSSKKKPVPVPLSVSIRTTAGLTARMMSGNDGVRVNGARGASVAVGTGVDVGVGAMIIDAAVGTEALVGGKGG